jgi:arylsulfatase A-like enzyme
LAGYDSACVGKWHLSGNLGNLHPNNSGFAHFAGFLHGAVADYFDWTKVVDGRSSPSSTYSTIDITNEAIASMESMPEPWFLYVAYNAPHAPLHVPPSELCHKGGCGSPFCSNLPPTASPPQLGRAMVESLDAELGRLLNALEDVDPAAYVFLLADNGTAPNVSVAPFLPAHAKGTLYEGGVNVPLIVRGPGVVHGECEALVSVVDLFATVTELAQSPAATEDSVSMVPYFADPALSLRASVYTESFSPNGGVLPFAEHRRAVRDARYKLIRITGVGDEFYDLMLDPFETIDLLPGLSAEEQAAFDALEAELAALGVD